MLRNCQEKGAVMLLIEKRLFNMQDLKYRDFHSRLMPTVMKENIIGVRIPQIKAFAKEISGSKEAELFLQELPHKYYEENNLHAFLTAQITDYDECIAQLEKFLPFIDNWATCDSLKPKAFAKNKERLIIKIKEWISSPHLYTSRFGIGMLMTHFLDSDFKHEYMQWVTDVETDEYYLMMMKAWFFATALAKQYNAALPYLEQKRLDKTAHNKTIRKAIESFRITQEQKAFLKNLKL